MQCVELVYSLLPRPKPKSPARTLASRSVAGTPLDRTPGKGPDPMPLSGTQGLYMWTSPTSEATPQSKASPLGTQGRPHQDPGSASPFDRPEVPPEWVYTGVCTFPLLYHVLDLRTCHSTSCLGLLLTRDLFQVLPRTARCC